MSRSISVSSDRIALRAVRAARENDQRPAVVSIHGLILVLVYVFLVRLLEIKTIFQNEWLGGGSRVIYSAVLNSFWWGGWN